MLENCANNCLQRCKISIFKLLLTYSDKTLNWMQVLLGELSLDCKEGQITIIKSLRRLLARPPAVSSLRSPTPPLASLAPTTSWRSDPRLLPQTASDGLRGRTLGCGLKRPRRSDWSRTAFKSRFLQFLASDGLGCEVAEELWTSVTTTKLLPSMICWHPKYRI